jgi:hypothetical protein
MTIQCLYQWNPTTYVLNGQFLPCPVTIEALTMFATQADCVVNRCRPRRDRHDDRLYETSAAVFAFSIANRAGAVAFIVANRAGTFTLIIVRGISASGPTHYTYTHTSTCHSRIGTRPEASSILHSTFRRFIVVYGQSRRRRSFAGRRDIFNENSPAA